MPALVAAAALFSALPAFSLGEPTGLRWAVPFLGSGSMELSWTDNCDGEEGFEVQFSSDGLTGWTTFTSVSPNATYLLVTGGGAGSVFWFRLRATTAGEPSAWSEPVEVTLPSNLGILHGTFMGGTVGEPLTGPTPTVFTNPPGGSASSFSVRDLPDSFDFDPVTGIITGTPTTPGVFRPIVSATDGSSTASTFVTFRIKPALSGPVEHTPVPDHLFLAPPATPICLDLSSHLDDPDTTAAIRISTNLGEIDTILYPEACPASVANLMNYIDRGDYTDVIFHRSAVTATSGVAVVQAGLMKPDETGNYTRVVTDPSVPDEPGLSNLTGSFAMAKTGARNSGTSQWYFNTIDNLNLDGPQSNGGYTVFGRAAAGSLPILADMHSRPRGTHPVVLDGTIQSFSDWPTTVVVPDGVAPALDEVIQITSVARLDLDGILRWALDSNDNPSLVTATLAGSELKLTPVPGATGSATLTIEVTDLDGTILPVDLNYCVLDLDLEAGLSPGGHLAATFSHEKLPANLSYQVQRSVDGIDWTTFWRSADGLGAAAVVENLDQGSRWRLTVEDRTISPPAPPTALLRIVVSKGE